MSVELKICVLIRCDECGVYLLDEDSAFHSDTAHLEWGDDTRLGILIKRHGWTTDGAKHDCGDERATH